VKAAESAAGAWLGIETISTSEGKAVLRMPTRAEMDNGAQAVHTGFIGVLAGSAMDRAMGTVLTAGRRHRCFDLKLNFVASGRQGGAADPGSPGQQPPGSPRNHQISWGGPGGSTPWEIGEHLQAVARVLHSGRRTGVAECRIEGEDGRLVATATASFIVYPPESQS
jgi:uncharacterized protein (TIGR00369 family)